MIRLCHPRFDAADRARVDAVLESGQLVQATQVAELEAVLGERLGRHAMACSNGTAALHLALLALDVGPGDDVIVPAFTWPSAVSTVTLVGANPVFCDVDAETFCIGAAGVRDAWTERTRALIAVHQFGIPADVAALRALCEERGAVLVEDAACAIGTLVQAASERSAAGQAPRASGAGEAGTYGALACFSFHPRKVLTTGEGGLVVTADDALAERVRCLRNHGQAGAGLLRFAEAGPNYRMPEISAALGIGAARRLDATLAHRRALAARYVAALRELPAVHVPGGVADPRSNQQSFVIRVRADRRDALLEGLRARSVQCTIGTYAVPQQPAFGGAPGDAFPVAWAAMHELVTLPLHEGMSHDDVDTVVRALRDTLEEGE